MSSSQVSTITTWFAVLTIYKIVISGIFWTLVNYRIIASHTTNSRQRVVTGVQVRVAEYEYAPLPQVQRQEGGFEDCEGRAAARDTLKWTVNETDRGDLGEEARFHFFFCNERTGFGLLWSRLWILINKARKQNCPTLATKFVGHLFACHACMRCPKFICNVDEMHVVA